MPSKPQPHSWLTPNILQTPSQAREAKTTRNLSAMPLVSRDPGGRDAKRGASALEQTPCPLSPAWSQLGSAQSHMAKWDCQFQHGKSAGALKWILLGWQGWRQMLPPGLSPGLSPKIWGHQSQGCPPGLLSGLFPNIWGQLSPRTGSRTAPCSSGLSLRNFP